MAEKKVLKYEVLMIMMQLCNFVCRKKTGCLVKDIKQITRNLCTLLLMMNLPKKRIQANQQRKNNNKQNQISYQSQN